MAEITGESACPACPCGEDHSKDFNSFGDMTKYANSETTAELAKLLHIEPTPRETLTGGGDPSWFALDLGRCVSVAKAKTCDEY